jgi:hypothetical protein
VAARVVARLTGDANRWMVECLDVGPQDRVLDIGCGPGLAVARLRQTADSMRAAGFEQEPASRVFGGVLHRALTGIRPGGQKKVAPLSTPRRTG